MYGEGMKGQFFILAAILVCVMFFVGLPLAKPSLRGSSQPDIGYLTENLGNEFPKALNLGMGEGNGITSLTGFTNFAKNVLAGQFIESGFFWIVAEGGDGSNLNVTAGNFLGFPNGISITVGGEEETLFLNDGSTGSVNFTGVSPEFTLSLGFASEGKSFAWRRDKVSLYVFMNLTRGEDLIRREVEG